MSRQGVKNAIALAVFLALLLICSLRSDAQGRAIMVYRFRDVQSVTVPKDLRCEADMKDGKETNAPMRCNGSAQVLFKRGAGTIEIVK